MAVCLNSELYDGDRNSKGQRHGQGMATWENGDEYSGRWTNGFPHGEGKFSFASGDEYVGDVRWGRRCGQGSYWYADGGMYTGAFMDDNEEGVGKRVWPNGDSCVGTWRHGYIDGRAVITMSNREVYSGWLSMSHREGRGKLERPDGSKYIGTWSQGFREGLGTLFLCDGSGYHGHWEHDRMHGAGTWYSSTVEKSYAGVWDRGTLRCESVEADCGWETFDPAPIPMAQTIRLPASPDYIQPAPLQSYWWAGLVDKAEHLSSDTWTEQGEVGYGEGDGLLEGEEPQYESSQAVYERSCKHHNTRVNKHIHAALPASVTTHELRKLDASATYLGDRGTAAFIELLSHCPNVSAISLQSQNLSPASIKCICKAVEKHPSIKTLDLAHNFISHQEGKLLSRLCSVVSHVETMNLTGTSLNPGVTEQIGQRLLINRKINAKRVITGLVR